MEIVSHKTRLEELFFFLGGGVEIMKKRSTRTKKAVSNCFAKTPEKWLLLFTRA